MLQGYYDTKNKALTTISTAQDKVVEEIKIIIKRLTDVGFLMADIITKVWGRKKLIAD